MPRLSEADQALIRELASVICEMANRHERNAELSLDPGTAGLLAKADKALWETWELLKPIPY